MVEFRRQHVQLRRTGLCMTWVKPRRTSLISAIPDHTVNVRTVRCGNSAEHFPVSPLLVAFYSMRAILSAYAPERIEAVPMDVLVDRDRASVVESEIGRCRDAVKPRTTLPGSPRQEQVVNFRTLAPGRSAPERMTTRNSTHYRQSTHSTTGVKLIRLAMVR